VVCLQLNNRSSQKCKPKGQKTVLRGTAVLLCCPAVSRNSSDRNLVCRIKHHRTVR
jgi:hypothetical protein